MDLTVSCGYKYLFWYSRGTELLPAIRQPGFNFFFSNASQNFYFYVSFVVKKKLPNGFLLLFSAFHNSQGGQRLSLRNTTISFFLEKCINIAEKTVGGFWNMSLMLFFIFSLLQKLPIHFKPMTLIVCF